MTQSNKPVFAILFFGLALASCKKNLVSDNAALPKPNVNKVIDTASNAYSYYPIRNKSTFSYVDTTTGGITVNNKSTIAILGDTIIDNKNFIKASTGASEAITYYNNKDGVTTLVSYNGNEKITSTVLKANEPVGAVWKDEFMNAGIPTTYLWKIVAKGIEKTVLGIKYTNVIHIHLDGTADMPVQGKVIFANSEYYYAPNIGLIENITNNPATGISELHRVLQNNNIIP